MKIFESVGCGVGFWVLEGFGGGCEEGVCAQTEGLKLIIRDIDTK